MEVKSVAEDLPAEVDITVPTPATDTVQTIADKSKSAVEKQLSRKFGQFIAYKFVKRQLTYLIRVDVGGEYVDVKAEYKLGKAKLKGVTAGKSAGDPLSF